MKAASRPMAVLYLTALAFAAPGADAALRVAQTVQPVEPITAPPQFGVRIGDRRIDAGIAAVFVTPGETLILEAYALPARADMHLETTGFGRQLATGSRRWRWRAPRTPGLYPITLRNRATAGTVRLNVFVKTPYRQQTQMEDYRIGRYQPQPLDDNPVYAPPNGLIAVTPGNRHARVAPDFTLGQFLCHQQRGQWPKYLLLRPRLLDKLQRLIAALRKAGIALDTLTVMSGFRTPWYNADIGNDTDYSRHLYGGAADIFVDTDDDGEMDDLNGDGRIDVADAEWLADVVETVEAARPGLTGGLSAYPANGYHGPFVHTDVRGTAVRW